jgi:hypothetical protein
MNAFHNESKATLGRIGRSVFNFVELMHECLQQRKQSDMWAASVVAFSTSWNSCTNAFHRESKATLGRIGRSVFNFVELMHECLPKRKHSDIGPHWS